MKWKDFACKCCGKGEPNPVLKEKVEKLELILGEEIICTCGTRCEKHNKELQEAWDRGERAGLGQRPSDNSYHMRCMAIDCKAVHASPKVIYLAMQSVGFGGIHAYKTFCHGDVGPDRRWP